MIQIKREPPPLGYLKFWFDGSVKEQDANDGAGLVIRGSNRNFIAAEGSYLHDINVPITKLKAAWEGLLHAPMVLLAKNIQLVVDF